MRYGHLSSLPTVPLLRSASLHLCTAKATVAHPWLKRGDRESGNWISTGGVHHWIWRASRGTHTLLQMVEGNVKEVEHEYWGVGLGHLLRRPRLHLLDGGPVPVSGWEGLRAVAVMEGRQYGQRGADRWRGRRSASAGSDRPLSTPGQVTTLVLRDHVS